MKGKGVDGDEDVAENGRRGADGGGSGDGRGWKGEMRRKGMEEERNGEGGNGEGGDSGGIEEVGIEEDEREKWGGRDTGNGREGEYGGNVVKVVEVGIEIGQDI